jgi:hypothetical protein
MSFLPTDAGRATSRSSRQANDCSVRTLALVRCLSYDDAYETLKAAGRTWSTKFKMTAWLDGQPWACGATFPASKGQRRMNPERFCADFPEGTWICKTATHVFVVRVGVVFDESPVGASRCIYRARRVI